MKKSYTILAVLLLIAGLSACNTTTEDERTLQTSLAEVSQSENITMSVESESDNAFTNISMLVKIEGQNRYTRNEFMGMFFEHYIIYEEGVPFSYMKSSLEDLWTRAEYEENENEPLSIIAAFDIERFQDTWFDKHDDVYVLNENYFAEIFEDNADELESFTITITEDDIVIIATGKATEEFGIFTITFTHIGSTVIEIPDFGEVKEPDTGEPDPVELPEVDPYLSSVLEEGVENEHTIVIETPGTYLIWSESDLALSADLYFGTSFLAMNSGGGPGHNFMFNQHFDAGTYKLVVYDWQEVEAGPYEVFVAKIDD